MFRSQLSLWRLLLLPAALSGHPDSAPSPESVLFEAPPAVETAALYTQTLQEAPANLTVITRQEIRRYGYRTLAEAISNVRGFFITFDGELYYGGVRGFSLPGDYNTRILVLVNGHYLADNVYSAMYRFGQDFGVDMDLIERIEIVRGPTSALYGSNGVFATINIFTRAPADSRRAYVSTELGSFGDKKTLVSSSMYLGRGANLLLSASGFHNRGRPIEAPELGNLRTDSVGAEQGYHTFAQLTWRDWSLTANFSDRKGIVPTGWFGTDFGNPGTSNRDSHDFVEVSWVKPVTDTAEIRWRLAYDQFRYYGRYHYTEDEITLDQRDYASGDWINTQFSYRRGSRRFGNLTVGTRLSADLRNLQVNEVLRPEYELVRHVSQPNHSYGVFAQQEWSLGKDWVLLAGLRLDDTRLDAPFLSPRLAAVWKATEHTSYKFMYGRAFRNPSTFERFWEPNPELRAERMNTFELAREQRVFDRLNLVTSLFHYRLSGLIKGVPVSEYILQYRNVAASNATGLEVEINGQITRRIETSGSFSLYHARSANPRLELPNSPAQLVQLRAAAPLARNRLIASTAVRYLSSRLTPHGFRVPPVAVADLTVTTHGLHRDFDVQFGVRNLTGRRYADPLSLEHLTQVMPRAGRTVFLKLIWRHGE
jgi:outer membrane receptor for ferrienterochelin and colicins